ncbi:hypothetical protein HMI54_013266, partial [Coelomomyces lativittatus]
MYHLSVNNWTYLHFTYQGNQTFIQKSYSANSIVENYRYVHDAQGRVVQLDFPPNASGAQSYLKYEYYLNGNLKAVRMKTPDFATE